MQKILALPSILALLVAQQLAVAAPVPELNENFVPILGSADRIKAALIQGTAPSAQHAHDEGTAVRRFVFVDLPVSQHSEPGAQSNNNNGTSSGAQSPPANPASGKASAHNKDTAARGSAVQARDVGEAATTVTEPPQTRFTQIPSAGPAHGPALGPDVRDLHPHGQPISARPGMKHDPTSTFGMQNGMWAIIWPRDTETPQPASSDPTHAPEEGSAPQVRADQHPHADPVSVPPGGNDIKRPAFGLFGFDGSLYYSFWPRVTEQLRKEHGTHAKWMEGRPSSHFQGFGWSPQTFGGYWGRRTTTQKVDAVEGPKA